jgi:hypothetical protein
VSLAHHVLLAENGLHVVHLEHQRPLLKALSHLQTKSVWNVGNVPPAASNEKLLTSNHRRACNISALKSWILATMTGRQLQFESHLLLAAQVLPEVVLAIAMTQTMTALRHRTVAIRQTAATLTIAAPLKIRATLPMTQMAMILAQDRILKVDLHARVNSLTVIVDHVAVAVVVAEDLMVQWAATVLDAPTVRPARMGLDGTTDLDATMAPEEMTVPDALTDRGEMMDRSGTMVLHETKAHQEMTARAVTMGQDGMTVRAAMMARDGMTVQAAMMARGEETPVGTRVAVGRMEIVDATTVFAMTVVGVAAVRLVVAVATTFEDVDRTAVRHVADEILVVAVIWVVCHVVAEPFSHRAKWLKAPLMVCSNCIRAVTAS